MVYKILAAKWWTPPMPGLDVLQQAMVGPVPLIIGAVAILSGPTDEWKVYIGFGYGEDEEADCQRIAAHGMPIGNKEAACGFFPHFKMDNFKY